MSVRISSNYELSVRSSLHTNHFDQTTGVLLVLVTKIRVCKSSVSHARGPDPPSQKQHVDAIEFSDQSSLIAKGHELKCQAKTLV